MAVPRPLKDARLDTRAARRRLQPRREPYWRSMREGMAIGYRHFKGEAGSWIARHYTPSTGRTYKALGAADDTHAADGVTVLDFAQAQEAARQWFGTIGATAGGLTVATAATASLAYVKAERKSWHSHNAKIRKHVLPELGSIRIADLMPERIDRWKRDMVRHDPADADVERASKDSANRVLTVLRALLNHATGSPGDSAWRRVRPFRKVAKARDVHLDPEQCARLINATSGAFRNLVIATLLTGIRPPGEARGIRVRHFDAQARTLSLPDGKTGPRVIVLTSEAVEFFTGIAAGRSPDALLLPRDDGTAWQEEHTRLMQAAVARAKLASDVTIYSCRHTYASQCILNGMNVILLARNMGTSVAMLERNYVKFIDKAKRELVEESGFKLGLKPATVTPMKARRK
jgi:integrase